MEQPSEGGYDDANARRCEARCVALRASFPCLSDRGPSRDLRMGGREGHSGRLTTHASVCPCGFVPNPAMVWPSPEMAVARLNVQPGTFVA